MSNSAPFKAQNPAEIKALVDELGRHGGKGKKAHGGSFSIRKNSYTLSDGRPVDSWKMQDWDYKKDGLPTYARGLFTRRNEKTGHWEIVARGYDKFFNHGEVRETEWTNVKKNTKGPYELSVKENGCIIFVGAVDDETVVVCSKHSTGGRGDPKKSHSVVGERWLDKHLKSVGKSKEQLAAKLRELNVTAVAELCDDAFEEHVLAYSPEAAGLYLHGLNLNLPEFATYPHHLVDAFAEEWGFKKTNHIVENDIDKVKSFLDGIAESGAYDGRDTEGFVIRCRARDSENAPYHDWFFKYKFEEPYLMYRQWRECTKAVIGGRTPFFKKHKKITEEYLKFARRKLAENRKLGAEYSQNHGIIALRDEFLAERGLKGTDIIRQEQESGEETTVKNNVFLVPVATIGCGKTTLGVALCKLFKWEEFQNDNIVGKPRRPERFVGELLNRAAFSPVVYADRNNHQKREREQLITDISKQIENPTFVALHWVHPRGDIQRINNALRERVLGRGDNHQTIHAAKNGKQEVIGIMDGFVKRFEPLSVDTSPDNAFDLVIDLDPLLPTRENLETVITKLHDEYPSLFPEDMPSTTDLDEAIAWAMNEYSPEVKHDLKFGDKKSKNSERDILMLDKGKAAASSSSPPAPAKAKKPPQVEFFCVRLAPAPIKTLLESMFSELPPAKSKMYTVLNKMNRIQPEFHVTLMHRASIPQHPDVWKSYSDIYDTESKEKDTLDPVLGACRVKLEQVVWDDKVMCIVVSLDGKSEGGQEWVTANKQTHITVGTANAGIKPVQSNALCEEWKGGKKGVFAEKVEGDVVLDGAVRAVLRR